MRLSLSVWQEVTSHPAEDLLLDEGQKNRDNKESQNGTKEVCRKMQRLTDVI